MNTDKDEVVEDTIYQVRNRDGAIRRYVRAVKVYGEKGIAECEIYHDPEQEESVGETINVDTNYLLVPDQYPKYMFNPNKWLSKVTQTDDEKCGEIERAISSMMKVAAIAVAAETSAAGLSDKEYVRKLVDSIKIMLTPIFGSFTLAMFIGFVKNKIKAALESQKLPSQQPKRSYRDKLNEMNRIWKSKPKPTVTNQIQTNKSTLLKTPQQQPQSTQLQKA